MPHSYDFFIANLECPICGITSASDTSTNMQTYIRNLPEMASLAIGDALDIDPEQIHQGEFDGYLVVSAPKTEFPIRILQTWECAKCDSPFNWAEVLISNKVIESIHSIEFNKVNLTNANLVANEVISIAADLMGQSISELIDKDIVKLLLENL